MEDLGPRYKLASSQLRVAETRARQALADADELRQKLATERAEGRAVANRLGFTARVATLESGQKQTDSMIERINQRLTFLLTEYSRMTEKKPVRRTEAA
ncbi:MAG TPA: hypothetical protein VM120_25225 [Bryobacteraceae bacterium]|nr:hypothetical protein [Bryobacteraceae bacterium]